MESQRFFEKKLGRYTRERFFLYLAQKNELLIKEMISIIRMKFIGLWCAQALKGKLGEMPTQPPLL